MSEENLNTTTIAPEVLHTIARLTTLDTPGVSRMGSVINPYDRVLTSKFGEGVKIIVKSQSVAIDIFVVLNSEENVRIISKNIQQRVSRAITEIVGMDVATINIHISDIDYDN